MSDEKEKAKRELIEAFENCPEAQEFVNNGILKLASGLFSGLVGDRFSAFTHKTETGKNSRFLELLAQEREIEEQKQKIRLYREMNNKDITDSEVMLLTLLHPQKTSRNASSSTNVTADGIKTENNESSAQEFGSIESIIQLRKNNKNLDAELAAKLVEIEERQAKVKLELEKARREKIQADIEEASAEKTVRDYENCK